MENDKEWLGCWLDNIELVLKATDMSSVYIPTVREEWIKAAKTETFSHLDNQINQQVLNLQGSM